MKQFNTLAIVAIICLLSLSCNKTSIVQNDIGLSDLFIESLTISPSNPKVSIDITIKAIIKNQGEKCESSSICTLKLNTETTFPLSGVPILGAGETYEVKRVIRLSTSGTFTAIAVVDSDNKITEENEDNNEKRIKFSVNNK